MRNNRAIVIGLVIVLLVAGAAFAGIKLLGGEDLETVIYQDPESPGPNPFTPPAVFTQDVQAAPDLAASPDASGTSTTLAAGATPSASPKGPFGGSGKKGECDVELLIRFLNENPERKQAWVDVLKVDVANFETYVRSLRKVILTRDVRVTNHGFKNGKAFEIQSILAAGTAVLVDGSGEIVTRCYCGNPLTPPRNIKYKCDGCPPNYTPPGPCNLDCYPVATTTTSTLPGSTTTIVGTSTTRRPTTRVVTTTRVTTTVRVTTVTVPQTAATTFPPAATTTALVTTPTTAQTTPTTAQTTPTTPSTTTQVVTTTQLQN